jgi:kynurenine 3-monooxygenase
VCLVDIRTAELVIGRSINLALSARGRKALAEVGLENKLLEHGIPMHARMIHNVDGTTKVIPYDRKSNQAIYSVGRKYLNEVLLDGERLHDFEDQQVS